MAVHEALKVGAPLWQEVAQIRTVDPNGSLQHAVGRLVHLTGVPRSEAPLQDRGYGLRQIALGLRREVQMFSLDEEGAGSWRASARATDLRDAKNALWHVPRIRLGAAALGPELAGRLDGWRLLPATPALIARLDHPIRPLLHPDAGHRWLHVGGDPMEPRAGDLRLRWWELAHGRISVLGKLHPDGTIGTHSFRDGRGGLIVLGAARHGDHGLLALAGLPADTLRHLVLPFYLAGAALIVIGTFLAFRTVRVRQRLLYG